MIDFIQVFEGDGKDHRYDHFLYGNHLFISTNIHNLGCGYGDGKNYGDRQGNGETDGTGHGDGDGSGLGITTILESKTSPPGLQELPY